MFIFKKPRFSGFGIGENPGCEHMTFSNSVLFQHIFLHLQKQCEIFASIEVNFQPNSSSLNAQETN